LLFAQADQAVLRAALDSWFAWNSVEGLAVIQTNGRWSTNHEQRIAALEEGSFEPTRIENYPAQKALSSYRRLWAARVKP